MTTNVWSWMAIGSLIGYIVALRLDLGRWKRRALTTEALHSYGESVKADIQEYSVRVMYADSEATKAALASIEGAESFKRHFEERAKHQLAERLAKSDYCEIVHQKNWVQGYTEVCASVRLVKGLGYPPPPSGPRVIKTFR